MHTTLLETDGLRAFPAIAMHLSWLRRFGRSVVTAITQPVLNLLDVEVGQKVELAVKDGALVVKRYCP